MHAWVDKFWHVCKHGVYRLSPYKLLVSKIIYNTIIILPVCIIHAGSTNGSSSQQQNLTCSNITCHEGFYCKEDASNGYIFCNPSCHTWKQYPHATNLAIDFLVLMSACIGVVSGVGVLVVAGIRWKKVYEMARLIVRVWMDPLHACCIQ